MLDTIETKTARMSILVLRGAVDSDGNAPAYVIDEKADSVTEDEAISYLASLTKPVECSAFSREGAIVIRCTPVARGDQDWYEHQVRSLHEGTSMLGGIINELQTGVAREVEFTAAGNSLRCNASDIRLWQEQYVIKMPVSIAAYKNANQAKESGLLYRLLVSRSLLHQAGK